MAQRAWVGVGALFALCCLPSCTDFSFNIGQIDEERFSAESRDGPASISISDPELYGRETLINDRRTEKTYLTGQLTTSETIPFTPQLQRELLTVTAVAGQLGLAFSPPPAASTPNPIVQEINKTALDVEFLKLLADVNALKLASAPAPAGSSPPPLTPPDVTATITQLQNLVTSTMSLLNASVPAARAASIAADPRETFADRQAYRLDIRSALSETDLDDRHDEDGHGLFRLQFRATVAPPQNLSKWGVAELKLARPEPDPDYFRRLYLAWLTHSTYRLNDRGLGGATINGLDSQYNLLAAGSGLFEVARIWVSSTSDGTADVTTDSSASSKTDEGPALDVCMHATSAREASALNCDALLIAVPRPNRDFIAPAFATFLDIDFRQIVSTLLYEYQTGELLVKKGGIADSDLFKLTGKTCDGSPVPTANGARGDLASYMALVSKVDGSAATTAALQSSTGAPLSTTPRTSSQRRPAATATTPQQPLQQTTPPDVSTEIGRLASTLPPGLVQDYGTYKKLFSDAPVNDKAGNTLDTTVRNDAIAARALGAAVQSFKNATASPANKTSASAAIRQVEATMLAYIYKIRQSWTLRQQLGLMAPQEALRFAQDMIIVAPVLSASLNGIAARRDIPAETRRKVLAVAAIFEEIVQSSREFIGVLVRLDQHCDREYEGVVVDGLNVQKLDELARNPPKIFCSVLRDGAPVDQPCVVNKETRLRGNSYAQATSPAELAQRISSVSNVADAIQLAAQLKGAVPTSGIAGNLGLAFSRQSVAKFQALERQPLVVGFAGMDDPTKLETIEPGSTKATRSYGSRFGWVFGPPARVDAGGTKLILDQALTSYQVTADVSVPGWWPNIVLDARTMWIGNWRDGALVEANEDVVRRRKIKVDLPLKRADLDGLTAVLAEKMIGRRLQLTHINAVIPPAISACASQVTVLVYGANVWRSTSVFMAGLPADQISVLPDMEGVSATFTQPNFANLQNRSNALGNPTVVVWTRDGWDEYPVKITGALNDSAKCVDKAPDKPSPSATAQTASIDFIAPTEVSVCDDTANITAEVTGVGMPTSAFFGSQAGVRLVPRQVPGPAISLGQPAPPQKWRIQMYFEQLRQHNFGLTTARLIAYGPEGIATGSIKLTGDPSQCGGSNYLRREAYGAVRLRQHAEPVHGPSRDPGGRRRARQGRQRLAARNLHHRVADVLQQNAESVEPSVPQASALRQDHPGTCNDRTRSQRRR
jgi:hypothetical protein